jgi:hypothetical protein
MNPAERTVALPLTPLLAVSVLGPAAACAVWTGGTLALGAGTLRLQAGAAASGVVAAAAVVHLLLLRPWKERSLLKWPMVWVGGSFLRLAITLGGAILLYSATPFRDVSLWFATVLAYVAVMVGETRVYASTMKRLAPAGAPAESPRDVPGKDAPNASE